MYRKILLMLTVLGVVLGSGLVSAMGLGQIKVQSALNQILQAEIELSGIQTDQIDEVQVQLASQRVFERLGVPRGFELTRLQFQPTLVGGKPVIKVTSKDPIREPFLTFLIQVQWSKGKLLREYTVLLDPPVFGQQAQAQLSQPTVAPKSGSKKTPSEPARSSQEQPIITQNSSSSRQASTAATQPTPVPQPLPNEYQSARGDTLWGIAEELSTGRDVGVNQMMMAIQAANPSAFIDNNINSLKAGQILRVPTDVQARALTESQATAEVKRQWLEWQQSRQIASAAPVQKAIDEEVTQTEEVATEEVMTDVAADSTSPSSEAMETNAELSIVSPADGVQGGVSSAEEESVPEAMKQLQNEVVLLREQTFAKEKQSEELQSRIDELESLLKKQERIITLQSKKLDQLQSSFGDDASEAVDSGLSSGEELQPVADTIDEVVVAESNENAGTEATTDQTDETIVASVTDLVDESKQLTETAIGIEPAVVAPLPDFDEPVPEEFAELENELFGESEETFETAAAEGESATTSGDLAEEVLIEAGASDVATPELAQVEQSAEPAGWMDKAMAIVGQIVEAVKGLGRNAIIGVGGLLAIVLGWIAFRNRKRSSNAFEGSQAMPPIEEMEESQEEEILDETVVATADAPESSNELSDMGLDDDDTIVSANKDSSVKGDEVIEEADVYLSYSLFQQAEDLLNEAIAKNPDNLDYKLKLAEVFAAAEKKDEFIQTAEDIKAQAGESSQQWKRVAVMGTALIPGAAMFGGMDKGVDSGSESVLTPEPKDPDFSFDEEDGQDSITSAEADDDMGLDFSLNEEFDDHSGNDDELLSDTPDSGIDEVEASVDSNDDDVFLDFDSSDLEQELASTAAESSDEEAAQVLEQAADDSAETMMFDRNALDEDAIEITDEDDSDNLADSEDSADTIMFDQQAADKDSEGLSDEMTEEINAKDLTRELETFNFDADEFEEASLPTMETQELSSSNLSSNKLEEEEGLSASDTSTLSAEMFGGEATEQFDISNIDTEMVELTEMRERGLMGDDGEDMEVPSPVEEAGTKLDLAKAFVDMGDPDAARETLTEVMEQGDDNQIKEAKALLDRIS